MEIQEGFHEEMEKVKKRAEECLSSGGMEIAKLCLDCFGRLFIQIKFYKDAELPSWLHVSSIYEGNIINAKIERPLDLIIEYEEQHIDD